MNDLYKKTNYLVDIPLLINANIIEYDISSANITMLLSYGLITQEEYFTYKKMDKMLREISIGKRGRNPDGTMNQEGLAIQKCINDGIIEAKRQLFEKNNLREESIVRIAKDAVYVNNQQVPYTIFDLNNNGVLTTFVPKNNYNIMINLNKLVTIFIKDNPLDDSLNVTVVGINDALVPLHSAFLEFICNLVSNIQRSGKEYTFNQYNDFYENYINMRLPIEYYREFNSNSGYRLKDVHYTMDNIPYNYKDKLDINYNLGILRTLYGAIMDL